MLHSPKWFKLDHYNNINKFNSSRDSPTNNIILQSSFFNFSPTFLRNIITVQGLIPFFFIKIASALPVLIEEKSDKLIVTSKFLTKLLKQANIDDMKIIIDTSVIGSDNYRKIKEALEESTWYVDSSISFSEQVKNKLENIIDTLENINKHLESTSVDSGSNTLILFTFVFWITSIVILGIPYINMANGHVKIYEINPIKVGLWSIISTLIAGGVGNSVYSVLAGLNNTLLSVMLASSIVFLIATVITSEAIKSWFAYHDLELKQLISKKIIYKSLKKIATSWTVLYFISVFVFALGFYHGEQAQTSEPGSLHGVQKREINPYSMDPFEPNVWQDLYIKIALTVFLLFYVMY